jgi:hypothetical protein
VLLALLVKNPDQTSLLDQLAENQQHDLTITYLPKAEGTHTASFHLQCNAKNSPVRAELNGQAEQAADTGKPATRLYRDVPYAENVEFYPLPEKSRVWMDCAACPGVSAGCGLLRKSSSPLPQDS